jgi:hypothetical protein
MAHKLAPAYFVKKLPSTKPGGKPNFFDMFSVIS